MKHHKREGSAAVLQEEIAALRPTRRPAQEALRRLSRRALLCLEAQHPQLEGLCWGGGPRLATLQASAPRYGLELELAASEQALEARLCVEPIVGPASPRLAPLESLHREARYQGALSGEEAEGRFLTWLEAELSWLPDTSAQLGSPQAAVQMQAPRGVPAPVDLVARRWAAAGPQAARQGWALAPVRARGLRRQAALWRSLGGLGLGGSAAALVAAALGWGFLWPSLLAAVASAFVGVMGLGLAPRLPRALPPAPGKVGHGLVLEKQRLTWGAGVAHINLQRPFSVHLTRSPGEASASASLLQISLHQKAQGAETGTRLDLAVPALLNAQMMALPELRTHAPVLSPEDVCAWIWPVLHYSSSVHGLRLPMEADEVIQLTPQTPPVAGA